MLQEIDFVIPWVDGNDPKWQSDFQKISPENDMDARTCRYRDWDLLRYWFRGVEQYTPWVNRIHFITWGHLPKWLNTEHPKINIINHRDYIPKEYLPSFSANTIELNIHRIRGLSENFVYFNDDMFLLNHLSPNLFFQNGLPCDSALLNPLYTLDLAENGEEGRIYYFAMNDVQQLNKFYSLRSSVRKHPLKWFNPKYGSCLIRNLMLSAWPRFVGFVDLHLPQPYLKQSFRDAWNDSFRILDQTCRHPIRSDHDVNQWYIRYRQLASGNFMPKKPIRNGEFLIGRNSECAIRSIKDQKLPMICLNDGNMSEEDYIREKAAFRQAFNTLLPRKSLFEN